VHDRQGTHRDPYKLNTSALLPRHGPSVSNLNFLCVDHLVSKERAQALNGRSIGQFRKTGPPGSPSASLACSPALAAARPT